MLKTFELHNLFTMPFSVRQKNRKIHTLTAPLSPWRARLSVCLIVMNFVLMVSYLAGVNSYTIKGYEIKKLQTKFQSLSDESKKLNLQYSQAASIATLQTDFANSNFVPVKDGKFLQVNQYTKK